MKFSDFICFGASIGNMEVTERDEVVVALIKSLDAAGRIKPGTCDEFIQAVIDRENEASTGMGKGVAVPHVKHALVEDVIGVVGNIPAGIDFAALDKQPVYSVILLLSPVDMPDRHLQAMENIFKHLQAEKFRRFLKQSSTFEAIEDLLREADENPSW